MKKKCLFRLIGLLTLALLLTMPVSAFGYGGGGGSGGGGGDGFGASGSGVAVLEALFPELAEMLRQAQRRQQLERRQRHWEAARDLANQGADQYGGWMGTAADWGPLAISIYGWGVGAAATGGWGVLGKLALGSGMGAAGGAADALGNRLAGNEARTLQRIAEGAAVGGITSQMPTGPDLLSEHALKHALNNSAPKHRVYESPEQHAQQYQMQGPGMFGTPGTIQR